MTDAVGRRSSGPALPGDAAGTGRRLRVAVCTDGPFVLWQRRCVEGLAGVPGVSLDLWVQIPPDRRPRPAGEASGARAAVPAPDALRALQPGGRSILTSPGSKPVNSVDVLLDLSSQGIALPVAWASEVWRYGYGQTLCRDPEPVTLVDYVRGPGVTWVALVSEPTGGVVREGWLRSASWRVGTPLESMLLDPAEWPALAARERTTPGLAPRAEPLDGSPGTTRWVSDPRGRHQRLAGLPRPLLEVGAAGRRMLELAEGVTRHCEWNVGIVQAPIDAMLAAGGEPAVTWLPPRAGHYAADPFGLERDGVLHVLFEDFSRRRRRGSISHVSITRDGMVSDPECVLDPGVHTSYPFLVEHDGAIFMLPETSAAGELVLFEAVDFPHRWRRAVTLLPGIPAVDASVIEHGGRWWMFAGIHGRGHNNNLCVWHAPDLTGPWTPHAANPVKTDARSARSGGTPFVSAGRLYRPSQDSSRRYGGRVVINRVDVLTPDAFAERPVRVVGPSQGSPYPHGLHTISTAGDRTLIDGNVLHFVRQDMQGKVAARLRRRLSS
jgi:hypothetical protein